MATAIFICPAVGTPQQARFFLPCLFEKLYDLHADPHELANLAAASAGKTKLEEGRRIGGNPG